MNIEFPKINNKLAFFDFDHTLVVHDYSKEYKGPGSQSYFHDCLYMLSSLEKEHANDRPLPCMQWYANKLFEDGYGIYVLTHEIFNLRDALKQKQIKTFYPNVPMTYLTVDTPMHKIDMMRAVAVSEGCQLSDILFVDDAMSTIYAAKEAGIDAKHLSEIVVMYENSRASSQQGSVLTLTGTEEVCTYESGRMDAAEGIPDSELNNILEDCRLLAERNGKSEAANL